MPYDSDIKLTGEEAPAGSDVTSDIDAINASVDGSTPSSSSESAAVTTLSTNIDTQAASISSSLNSLLGSAPASNRLDQIDSFISSASVPPNSLSDIDDINALVDGSTPTSASEAAAIANVENNIQTQAENISDNIEVLFGTPPSGQRLDEIDSFLASATVPPDSLSDIDDINLLVDGSTPTSANEGAAITNVESNISTQAASISSGLNTLFGSSPAGNRLDQIDDFVANATIPSTDPETFTSWVVGTRPDGNSLSEGDFAVDTTHGRGYRWDDTVGALLPVDVYGNTFDLTAHVNGDEADASELDNFDDNHVGTGAANYNGTNVTLDGGNSSNQSSLLIDSTLTAANIDNTKNLYWRAVIARGTSTSNINFGFVMRDGSNELNLRVFSSNPFRRLRYNNLSSEILTALTDDAPFKTGDSDTHVVEMYVKRDSNEDVCFVIVDGKVYHLSAFVQTIAQATNTTCSMFAKGYGSGDNCDMVVYESTFCVW